MGYFIIVGAFALIGMLVSNRLKSKFRHYAQVPMTSGMSGAEIAQKMLSHYGIRDVQITQGKGFLTDHYNPQTKTVTLSPEVYQGRNVSAAAVAAHECGHAVQHAEAYTWLTLRSKLVPVVQLSARAQSILFMVLMFGGLGMGMNNGGGLLMQIFLATFFVTALFAVITLPVEFDASKRALAWLENSNVATGVQQEGAKDALWWAAMTYVVSALGAITVFLYFFLSSRD